MVQGKKLVPFIIPVTLAVLTLLPFIKASQEHAGTENSRTIKNDIRLNKIVAVFLATTGAILSIRNFENSFNNNHQRIGLALYGVVWLQALIGFIRPRRGSRGRSVWFLVHWGLGTVVSLLGIINVYTGLQAFHKRSSKNINLWTTIFTAEVLLVAFFYLFQDKWNYIKEQGVILGDEPIRPTDQDMSPREEKKKKKNEFLVHETPC